MDKLSGMTRRDYPAVVIEHQFAQLLEQPIGQRGKAWDADVWRGGNKTKIESALRKASAQIGKRLGRAKGISSADMTTLQKFIAQFDQEANAIKVSGSGPDNPQWVTLGEDAHEAHVLLTTYGV